MPSRAGKEGKVQPAAAVGQHSYSLRRARPLSNRALEVLADGQGLSCQSRSRLPKATDENEAAGEARVGNIQPEVSQVNEGEGAVEVHTGNTQLEGSTQPESPQENETEEDETGVSLENNSDDDETTSLSSDFEDPEDARNFIPTTEREVQALTNAVYPTWLQYVDITGRTEEISDAHENYFSQWAFYQQHLDAVWARCGWMSVPPRLIARDRWTGGIENWRFARELNNGKLTGR
ncbi:hypothetical protein MMC07_005668 [Pseudocyphellaria aurata]|nr:hypothetical protein [Pseudocyphellaria aurata]